MSLVHLLMHTRDSVSAHPSMRVQDSRSTRGFRLRGGISGVHRGKRREKAGDSSSGMRCKGEDSKAVKDADGC